MGMGEEAKALVAEVEEPATPELIQLPKAAKAAEDNNNPAHEWKKSAKGLIRMS